MQRPRIGERAPDLNLSTPTGDRWDLSAHRGRYLVLIFHRHIH